jgi:hypothetical protein
MGQPPLHKSEMSPSTAISLKCLFPRLQETPAAEVNAWRLVGRPHLLWAEEEAIEPSKSF